MFSSKIILIASLFLSTASMVAANNHLHRAASHERVALVRRGTTTNDTEEATLRKRGSSRFTNYAPGLGACGGVNGAGDFIVALNGAQWDGGSHCYATITISYEGKTAQAQITDECPDCPYGALDLTPGLFSFFASLDLGVIYGDWSFGSAPAPAPAPAPSPSPSPSPAAEAQTPANNQPASTTPAAPSTTATTTSQAKPTTSTTPSSAGAIGLVGQAVMQLGGLVVAAEE